MTKEQKLAKKVWDALVAQWPDEDEWLIAASIVLSRLPAGDVRDALQKRMLDRGIDATQEPSLIFVEQIRLFCDDVYLETTMNERPMTKQERKERPMARGLLNYFPDALAEVAYVSFVGNQQHNPGEEMHWAKEKSSDHADCIMRHLIDAGKVDDDGLRHSAKVAWRALALLQIELETDAANSLPQVEEEVEATNPYEGKWTPISDDFEYVEIRDGEAHWYRKDGTLDEGMEEMAGMIAYERHCIDTKLWAPYDDDSDFEEFTAGLPAFTQACLAAQAKHDSLPLANAGPTLEPSDAAALEARVEAAFRDNKVEIDQYTRDAVASEAYRDGSHKMVYQVMLEQIGCPEDVAKQIVQGISVTTTGTPHPPCPWVYVAGPMRGIKDFNFPAFDAARNRLLTLGYNVISPADMERDQALMRDPMQEDLGIQARYAKRDLWSLLFVHAQGNGSIALLPEWTNSIGAMAEHAVARWLGLTMLNEEGEARYV